MSRLEYDYRWELRDIRDVKLSLDQEKLFRKARRLGIPLPRQDYKKLEEDFEDDNWYYTGTSSDVLLKAHATVNLRREVRREQKEKWDLLMPWLSLLVALFGTVAAGLGVWSTWSSSQAALNYSIERSRLDQRAWLGPVDFNMSNLKEDSSFTFRVTISNSGKTPAVKVRFNTGLLEYPAGKEFVPQYEAAKETTGLAIQPGAKLDVPLRVGIIRKEQIERLRKTQSILYTYGIINYEDVFQLPHSTTFCIYLDSSLNIHRPCKSYNNAD